MTASGVSDAREALAGSAGIDLLVVDSGAGVKGVRDIVHIARSTPRTSGIPVIALMDGGDLEGAAEISSLGCDEILEKPLDHGLLMEKAGTLLWSPQRASARVGCGFPARVVFGREVSSGEVVQVCEDGAGLILPERLREEGVLALKFTFPDGEEISVAAVVVHIERRGGGYFHGISFISPGVQTRERIRVFVGEKTAAGGAC